MALYTDTNGFPEGGFPVLSDVQDNLILNTLYQVPQKYLNYRMDVVGNNRLLGNLVIGGTLTGVSSLTMSGALSGVTTLGASSTVTLSSDTAPLTLSGTNAVLSITGANASIGTSLSRVNKTWLKDLNVLNRPTIGEDYAALVGDLRQYAFLPGRVGDILKIDEIQEFTSSNGVKIDGIILKDIGINFEVGATTRIFKDGSNNLSFTDAIAGTYTLQQLVNASMVYPGAGIAISTGSAWATSIPPSTGYLRYTGSTYEWKNETYSLSNHNHDTLYAPIGTVSSQWVTSGSDIYYNTGNVGIGTEPAYKLHLAATPPANGGVIYVRDPVTLGTDSFAAIGFASTPGHDWYIGKATTSAGAGLFQVRDHGHNVRMSISGDGNVGIGTTEPQRPLHSVGEIPLRLERIGVEKYDFVISDNGTSDILNIYSVDQSRIITTFASNGRVGIGITNPSYDFESALSTASLGNKAVIIGRNDEIWSQPQTNANASLYINYRGYADGLTQFRDLYIANGKGTTIASFIGASESVGIGRTPTTYKLEIEGSSLITTKLYLGTTTAPATDTGTLNSLVWDNTTGEVKQRAITGGFVKPYQALTSSTSVSMNVRSGQNAIITLGHNVTLTLSNLVDGDEGNIVVKQDATGSRSLTISPTPKVINGGSGAIVLTATANATDMLSYTYTNSILYITYGKNYS